MTQVEYEYADFTAYASTYEQRPDYAPRAIEAALRVTGVRPGDPACDVGSGSAHLAIPLLEHGLRVDAVEPTAAMREIGQRRTAGYPTVSWSEGVGERTGRPDHAYELVTFGSSFDRTDQPAALRETARLLRPGGHFLCCWNHRDFDDPLQAAIQDLIASKVPGFRYGLRRDDPTRVIVDSGLFTEPVHIASTVVHELDSAAWCAAWSSHMTLGDQAGEQFEEVLDGISALVRERAGDRIRVPYTTRMWVAKLREDAGDAR
ncbi:Methyltransferase domain-containing protein [Amycolatopsis pretoriensis]|uniref:Methyltransferase domain-containing protein n=1 Tax=Amycolatopsis pretoriensis TaxID=218821 RepID=A0A1H5RIG2_9PSEU|nr:class I SAM-dependent methyltransferase [Amycolatopsis pretoriensis]SEF37297.1 Methyltransferase domain-containing protein [Amycolatopsis pretoriensis]